MVGNVGFEPTISWPQTRRIKPDFPNPRFVELVGIAGFEPTTTCPPDKCATRLRYTPLYLVESVRFELTVPY